MRLIIIGLCALLGIATLNAAGQTTQPASPAVSTPAPAELLVRYDLAISGVTGNLGVGGLWINGISATIDLPKTAEMKEVIDLAVQRNFPANREYELLRARRFVHKDATMTRDSPGWAALLRMGGELKVLIAFPDGEKSWWNRFYDARLGDDLSFPPYWSGRWDVTMADGCLSTYSSPRDGTYCLLDLGSLLRDRMKIEFFHDSENAMQDFDWYLPVGAPFEVATVQSPDGREVTGLKLVSEDVSGRERWILMIKNRGAAIIYEKDESVHGVVTLVARE